MGMNDRIPPSSAQALQNQEVLFSLVMSVIALLCRDNPLVSTEILWVFGGMLAFNLAYHRCLRAGGGVWAPLVSIGVNVVLSAAAVAFSGGAASSFWPLFLLPVFTACLYLEARHVAASWLAAGAFLAFFYVEGFWEFRRWELCEYLIKLGVLGFAAAVTAHLSFRERQQRAAGEEARARVDSLARSLERRTAAELLALRRQSMSTLVPGIIHALQTPLTVVLGTVELLIQEAPEGSQLRADLERIRSAARRCAQVGEDLLDNARAEAALQ